MQPNKEKKQRGLWAGPAERSSVGATIKVSLARGEEAPKEVSEYHHIYQPLTTEIQGFGYRNVGCRQGQKRSLGGSTRLQVTKTVEKLD